MCDGLERHQMLKVINDYPDIQIKTLQNRCKVQSSTFSTGNPLIQVLQCLYKYKSLHDLAGFPKFSHVDLRVPGAYGVHCAFCASGVFPSVVPSVHNGSAIWLSSLFSERFSESGKSKLGSGGCIVLDEAYL